MECIPPLPPDCIERLRVPLQLGHSMSGSSFVARGLMLCPHARFLFQQRQASRECILLHIMHLCVFHSATYSA
jgi:hypothetical protein